jgi:hypothetical protein
MGQETLPSGALIVDAAAASNSVSVVRSIRSLLVTAVLAALICSWVILGSKGGCLTQTGVCYDLRLSVSPLLFIGFVIIVFVALGRIINRNLDPFEASRVLDRARLVVKIVALVAIVVSQVWFWAIPMDGFGVSGFTVISPFPFGIIELTTSTMTG